MCKACHFRIKPINFIENDAGSPIDFIDLWFIQLEVLKTESVGKVKDVGVANPSLQLSQKTRHMEMILRHARQMHC